MKALAACALAAFLPSPVAGAETLDRVVASVDYQAVTGRDVESEFHYEQLLNGKLPEGTPDAQTREEIRNRLVEQALLSQEARDSKLPDVTEEALAQDLADIQKKFDSPKAFQDALQAAGLDTRQFLERLRRRNLIERLTDLRLRPQAWVEQSEIEAYFKDTFIPEFKQHNQASPPTLDEVEDKIRRILAEEKINKLLDEWIADLKTTHRVVLNSM